MCCFVAMPMSRSKRKMNGLDASTFEKRHRPGITQRKKLTKEKKVSQKVLCRVEVK
jgi:hypothetical protein